MHLLTAQQVDNLQLLASYLDGLPADYDRFDMTWFARAKDHVLDRPISRIRCGTVACAVGHGPQAGIPIVGDPSWGAYSRRVFGMYADWNWRWCFEGGWKKVDNSPAGAAARIRYFLAHGDAPDAFDTPSRLWPPIYEPFLASGDTHPKGGDANAAPFMSGAIAEGETPDPESTQ